MGEGAVLFLGRCDGARGERGCAKSRGDTAAPLCAYTLYTREARSSTHVRGERCPGGGTLTWV